MMVKTEPIKEKKLKADATLFSDIHCEEFYGYVLKANKPVVVDFWADWCTPCRTVKPILEKLAEKYKNKISFYRIDADTCPNIVSTYQISSIPTLVIYYQGNSVERLVGVNNISEYERFINDALVRLNN